MKTLTICIAFACFFCILKKNALAGNCTSRTTHVEQYHEPPGGETPPPAAPRSPPSGARKNEFQEDVRRTGAEAPIPIVTLRPAGSIEDIPLCCPPTEETGRELDDLSKYFPYPHSTLVLELMDIHFMDTDRRMFFRFFINCVKRYGNQYPDELYGFMERVANEMHQIPGFLQFLKTLRNLLVKHVSVPRSPSFHIFDHIIRQMPPHLDLHELFARIKEPFNRRRGGKVTEHVFISIVTTALSAPSLRVDSSPQTPTENHYMARPIACDITL